MLKARLKAALPATVALARFLWANRKMEMAIGAAVATGVEEIVRALTGGV